VVTRMDRYVKATTIEQFFPNAPPLSWSPNMRTKPHRREQAVIHRIVLLHITYNIVAQFGDLL